MTASQGKAPANKPAAELVSAVVARGRTVKGADGKPRRDGEEIQLPAAEVRRLQSIGFLVDEKAPAIPHGIGPDLYNVGGVSVKRV
jgi:hypothetical protein